MSKLSVAAVVLARNEASSLGNCLDSLEWCDEVLVIDDSSTDETAAIAKHMGVRVVHREMKGDFAVQRNFALTQVQSDWVLFVDADERVSKGLGKEIKEVLSKPSCDAYRLHRSDVFIGRKLRFGDTGAWCEVRLARRRWGMWEGKVHEQWKGAGRVGCLNNPLLHEPHGKVSDFLESINRYTTLRAEELWALGKRAYWWEIILYPKVKFIDLYFMKQGFRDGSHGLVHAALMSLHSFLVRSKLYLLNKKRL